MTNVAPEPEAVAPGTGMEPGTATDPSVSEDVNSAEGQDGGVPSAIPYTRFKEVNDQLRPYKELEKLGYDADSLHHLAQWEQEFSQNPVENWLNIARKLDGLPEAVLMAIKDHFDEPYVDPEDIEDDDEEEEPAATLPPEAQEAIQWMREQRERQSQQERLSMLNGIMEDWTKQNKTEELEELDEDVMLTFIAGAAGTGSTKEEILKNARDTWLKTRTLALGAQVKLGRPGFPVPVSGGAAPTGPEPIRARDFNEANALAREALAKGMLGG